MLYIPEHLRLQIIFLFFLLQFLFIWEETLPVLHTCQKCCTPTTLPSLSLFPGILPPFYMAKIMSIRGELCADATTQLTNYTQISNYAADVCESSLIHWVKNECCALECSQSLSKHFYISKGTTKSLGGCKGHHVTVVRVLKRDWIQWKSLCDDYFAISCNSLCLSPTY